MASNRLNILFRKIKDMEDQIDSFKIYLDKFEFRNPASFPELQIRMQETRSLSTRFNEIYEEIQSIDSETDYSLEKRSLRESCYRVLGQAQYFIESVGAQTSSNVSHEVLRTFSSNSPRNSISSNTHDAEPRNFSDAPVNGTSIRLPEAKIPTFDGKIEKFLSFKNRFERMIHKNPKLTKLDKLQYLQSALKGEALRKISTLDDSESNYDRAWDNFVNAYYDPRLLISRHMTLLLHLPVQEKETAEGLTLLADETNQHVQSLEAMDIYLTPEMVVTIVEEKLPKNTLEKWEDKLEDGKFPTFDKLKRFLHRTARRISKRRGDHLTRDEPSAPPNKKRKSESKAQTFVTSTNSKCPVCSESHPIFKCESFLQLSIDDRIKKVKDAELCFNCLHKGDHRARGCKFGTCKKCNKKHNTLLHIERNDKKHEPEK